MSKTLPLIFFGSSQFSVYVLKEFLKKYKPLLVITLKDKPKGRGLKIQPNIVYSFCLKEKLNVIELESWEQIKYNLSLIKPIIGVIASFGKIIPQEIINFFPKGIINIHPSLLPKYRGPNPIRETILQGDEKSGITLFSIDNLVDHGPIIKQETISLTGKETYADLEKKLGKLGGEILNQTIEDYLNNKLDLIEQNDNLATFTKKNSKEDGLLNLNDSYQVWDRKIRALNPWPGTYIYLQNKILKIFNIEKIDKPNFPANILKKKTGEFFEFKNNLYLKLSDAFIILKEVQLEGRKRMSGKEFLNGFRKLFIKEN